MGRPSRYPPPFRAQAVAHVARIRPQHRSAWHAITTVAAALDLSAETLRGWVRQAEAAGVREQRKRRQEQDELRRLHQENTRLRQTLLFLQGTAVTPAPSVAVQRATEQTRPGPRTAAPSQETRTNPLGPASATID